jgi:hypothetical protein
MQLADGIGSRPKELKGKAVNQFDDSFNSVKAAIEAGIAAAGYQSRRIDQKQHNNQIDDEIIAATRWSPPPCRTCCLRRAMSMRMRRMASAAAAKK